MSDPRCPPFARAVLAEATRIAPNRDKASDGIVGDAAHQARTSDHNPSVRGFAHAVDVTQDAGVFDADAYGEVIAQRVIDGFETRVKYLVSHNYKTGSAKIFNPSIGRRFWRDQDGDNHASHLHTSFLSEPSVEESTDPYFEPVGGARVGGAVSSEEETIMIVQPNKKPTVPGRVCTARLNVPDRVVELFNGAAIAFDEPTKDPQVRRWRIGARAADHAPTVNGTPLGLAALPDGSGVVVTMSDHGTFVGKWS